MLKKLQSERGKSVKSKKNWKIKNYCIEKKCHADSGFTIFEKPEQRRVKGLNEVPLDLLYLYLVLSRGTFPKIFLFNLTTKKITAII